MMNQLKVMLYMILIMVFAQASFNCSTGSVNNGQKIRLGISNLTSDGLDKKTVKEITLKLYNKIRTGRGPDRVVYRDVDGISKSVNRQLYGTVNKLGSRYAINIKIVNSEKGNIVFGKVKMVDDIKEIDSTIEDIANEIGESIW